jgi:GT2 family glycosyltransferase
MIDIIVPIYGGVEWLRRCVDSILGCTQMPFRLLLIDDASPGTTVSAYLEDVARRSRCAVFRNDINLGFAGTVNRGLRMSNDDVVILNSDVIVTRGWLEKMRTCAYSQPRVATVTPLTTEGSICAVPEWNQKNPLPPGHSLEELSSLIEHLSARTYPEILTGVGFCMYIRREAIEKVGEFDAATFRHGYGEDSDFCMRATGQGFKHLLDDATFVYHEGGASFGSQKAELVESIRQLFLERHPQYLDRVSAFIAGNPLRAIQSCIRKALAGDVRPRVRVLVLQDDGGDDAEAMQREVRNLVRAVEAGDLLVGRFEGSALIVDEFRDGMFVASERIDEFDDAETCRETWRSLLRSRRIEVMQVLGIGHYAGSALAAARDLGIPTVLSGPEGLQTAGSTVSQEFVSVDVRVFSSRAHWQSVQMACSTAPQVGVIIANGDERAYGDLYRRLGRPVRLPANLKSRFRPW